MMGIAFTMWSLLPVLLLSPLKAPTSAGPPSTTRSAHYGIPRLAPGQVWVSSVPVGLEVRVGEDARGRVIGRTPLVLLRRDAGPFVTVTIQKKDYGGKLPPQLGFADFTVAKTHSSSIRQEVTGAIEDVDRSLTYKVRLPEKQTVIALFQAKELPLSDLARLYPPGSNFRFSDEIVRKSLEGRHVSPEFIRAGIPLLHQGGKMAFPSKGGWLVAEATASGQVELFDENAERP
ncbi:MAG TPA: hypothetical protein VGA31_10690 [Thermoanaerobaculia bacterium]